MKKALIKILAVLLSFLVSGFVASRFVNLDTTDMTSDMAGATLPVVSIQYDDLPVNTMFGYTSDMELSYMRNCITPLMPGRRIRLVIDRYNAGIREMAYEVRTVDGSRLIEDTPIDKTDITLNRITADIIIKDLIRENTEYELIVKLTLSDGRVAKYYSRILNPDEYYVSEKLSYVRDFTDRTFNRVLAEDLTKYLESNSQGDNTNYGYVNIHSSFKQITWGDLDPLRVTEPVITIKELSPLTGSFITDFYVSTTAEGGDITYYKVREYFRIRYSKERMYLLDYERTMDEVFTQDKDSFANGAILLGINSGNIRMNESEDGNNLAFTTGGRLYSYGLTENRVAYLFGFYEKFNEDIRTMNDQHEIKVLKVDEAGNVTFLIYGYMNRGTHEGEAGTAAYYYDATVNTIEELAYIPSAHAPDLLIREVDELSYMNSDEILYLLSGSTLFGINAKNHTVEAVAQNLTEGSYQISDNNRLVAYQEGEKGFYDCQTLLLQNLDTGRVDEIKVRPNETIIPVSFIGEDLIYGIARKSDITKDKTGGVIVPMYQIIIHNLFEGTIMTYGEEPELSDEYDRDTAYVVSGEVKDNQIILKRVRKDADGELYETSDDQIVNALDEVSTKNVLTTVATEAYEKLRQINLKKENDASSIKYLSPKLVLFEGSRSILLKDAKDEERYVVYGKYGVDSLFTREGSAVNRAYDISGTVMDGTGVYLYKKTGRSTRNQIMAIKEAQASEDRSSPAVCLDTILEYEGLVRNSQYMLNNGYTVTEILKDALTEYDVLDLTGCSLDALLYYVNQDIPVMAMLDNGDAVLIIGFNESNTVIMDPMEGTIYKKGIEDSTEWFKENGNSFITYVRRGE